MFQLVQADDFGKAAALVTFILLVAVVARNWISKREDSDAAIGGMLLGISLIAVAAVIIAAIAGPHPS